jgi:hypothetical protein
MPHSNEPLQTQSRENSSRAGFTIKQLLLAIALFAVVLAIWLVWTRKAVTVRPAEPDNQVYSKYFGIDEEAKQLRNIAVVEGTFTKSTWLSSSLYFVKAGQIEELNAFTVGRSPNRIGESIWLPMKITLALGELETASGRRTQLGSAGHTRGGGRAGNDRHRVQQKFSQTFARSVVPGREYIVYAEGEKEPTMSDVVTVNDFAQQNDGNYLVVTVQLH